MKAADEPPSRAPQLLVVRHGQSVWNREGRWQGDADPPLTDHGRAQARAAARVIGSADRVWASDLQRAAETAAIIASEVGAPPPNLHPGLREGSIGPWQGLTIEEIDRSWPGYRADGRRPTGAEDPDLVERRVVSALHHIVNESAGRVVVVTHAGALYAVRRSLGLSFLRYGNLSGFRATIDDQGGIAIGESVMLADGVIPDAL